MEGQPQGSSDRELVARSLVARDAFDQLVGRYFAFVYAIAFARLQHRESAEEVTQEVFLRAFLKLDTLHEPDKLAAWLAAIARTQAETWRVRGQTRSRLIAMVPLEEVQAELPDNRQIPVREKVAIDDEASAIREAIAQLDADSRELVLLHFFEGLSKSELARRLALHPSSIGRRLQQALALLRKRLRGLSSEDSVRSLAPSSNAKMRAIVILSVTDSLPRAAKAALARAAGDTLPATAGSSTHLLSNQSYFAPSGGKSMFVQGMVVLATVGAIVGGAQQLRSNAENRSTPPQPTRELAQLPPRRDPPTMSPISVYATGPATEGEASPTTRSQVLGVREMEDARITSKVGKRISCSWAHNGGVFISWGSAGDAIEWDVEIKEFAPDLKMALRYAYDEKTFLSGNPDADKSRTIDVIVDNGEAQKLSVPDTGGWNHYGVSTIDLLPLSPGMHNIKLVSPVDKMPCNMDCVTFYRGDVDPMKTPSIRPLRLHTSEHFVICASPLAVLHTPPQEISSVFEQLREIMLTEYGKAPEGVLCVHFADPMHWDFRNRRAVSNQYGIYLVSDSQPERRDSWCWALAAYFGSRDVPAWFRHSAGRVNGLLTWLPALDASTTESEDAAGAELVVKAREFLQNANSPASNVEIVHAAMRLKYGEDVFRKFWSLVDARQAPGPLDKLGVLSLLSQAAGEDVTQMYKRWTGYALEGPVDPLVLDNIQERAPSAGAATGAVMGAGIGAIGGEVR